MKHGSFTGVSLEKHLPSNPAPGLLDSEPQRKQQYRLARQVIGGPEPEAYANNALGWESKVRACDAAATAGGTLGSMPSEAQAHAGPAEAAAAGAGEGKFGSSNTFAAAN